jgi:hypothetical protein
MQLDHIDKDNNIKKIFKGINMPSNFGLRRTIRIKISKFPGSFSQEFRDLIKEYIHT